jgi:diguanylate cyclase (GGDEF)-like protein
VAVFLERRRLPAGERLFNEGDRGEDMFILLSGALSAHRRQSDGTQRWMFDTFPGTFLGEMSVIVQEPRLATVTAREDSELAVLNGQDFYQIIYEHPLIGIKILRSMGRVQNTWLNQTAGHLKDLVLWGKTARRRAITDELTGLYNRNFLEESVKDWFRTGASLSRPLTLIMMDLDKVHEINECHGQAGGDAVIITVARALKTIGRPEDIAIRLSGDEFAILLPDTPGPNALIVAERIRRRVLDHGAAVPRDPGSAETVAITVGASFGVAWAPRDAQDPRTLVSAADDALRRAKELGRNRVELYS